jgi:hypothetical protein
MKKMIFLLAAGVLFLGCGEKPSNSFQAGVYEGQRAQLLAETDRILDRIEDLRAEAEEMEQLLLQLEAEYDELGELEKSLE